MPLRFRRVSPDVSIPALDLDSNTVTITAWVKGRQDADFTGIVYSNDGTTIAGFSVVGGVLRYTWDNDHWGWDSGLAIPVDTWTFIALVVSATQATLYVNGASATNVAAHAVEAFDGVTKIGRAPGTSNRQWIGLIDDVRIHDATLTPTEVATIRTTGVSPASLIHRWKLDEASGTTAEDSTGSADGTLNNAPLWRPNQGHDGGAILFDAIRSYVDFGTAPGSAAALTACFWVEPTKKANQKPVDKLPSTGGAGWSIRFNDTGGIQFFVGSNDAKEVMSVSGAYAVGVRAHYAFTFSGNTGKIYKNGLLIGTKADFTKAVNDASAALHIGRPSTIDDDIGFDGIIEDLRIYDDDLTLDEVAEIFHAQGLDMNMRALSHLVLRAPLRGQTDGRADGADIVKDFSPNGHDGTPTKYPRYDPGFVRLARP